MTRRPATSNRRSYPGRTRELVLLGFTAALVVAGLAIVDLSQENQLTLDLVGYGAAYLALFTVAHMAVRRFAPYADPLILPIVALLNGIGLVMIYRLDLAALRKRRFTGDVDLSSGYATQQVLWSLIGVLLFTALLVAMRDHRVLARYSYTLGLVGLIALALPAVLPASMSEVNGAKIWIRLPFMSIQPGEFAKILLLIFFAALLVSKRELFQTAGRRFLGMDFPRPRDLAPVLASWAIAVLIMVLEKDLGTALLLFGTVLAMIYVATEKPSWVVIGLTLFLGAFAIAYKLFGHVQIRVETWLDPFAYADDKGYQLTQSLLGIGTGGLAGTGLGNGRPDIVPFANTDFIIAALGEELGLFGLTAIIALYAVLILRGMRIAMQVRDSFGKLLAAGLSFTVMVQLFVVVGGVTRLIPMTGLTTPFVSYGGSSLLANYLLVAILLRISHTARKPVLPAKKAAPLTDAKTEMLSAVQR